MLRISRDLGERERGRQREGAGGRERDSAAAVLSYFLSDRIGTVGPMTNDGRLKRTSVTLKKQLPEGDTGSSRGFRGGHR